MEQSRALKLEDVLQHRLTGECLSIFNVNGTMCKVQKSKLQEKLSMTAIPEPDVYTSIVDMGLIWRLAAPTTEDREKGDDTMYTWGDYPEKVVRSVLARHKHAERIICMNDPYDQNFSIKDTERMLHQKGKPISNMRSENKCPLIKDFHALLGNSGNKIPLQAFLEKAFQRSAATSSTEIIYCVVCSIANNLTTGKFVPESRLLPCRGRHSYVLCL